MAHIEALIIVLVVITQAVIMWLAYKAGRIDEFHERYE